MDKQPRHDERTGRPGTRQPEPEGSRSRSGRGAATALERLKQLEREAEWLRRKDQGKPEQS